MSGKSTLHLGAASGDSATIIRRISLGAKIAAAMVIAFAVHDYLSHPAVFPSLVPFKLLQVFIILGTLAAVRLPSAGRLAIPVSRVAIVLYIVSAAGQAIFRQDLITLGVSLLTVLYLDAVLIPAGWRGHLIAALAAAVAMVASAVAVTGSVWSILSLPALAMWVAGAASTFIAHELSRTRADVEQQQRDVERGRDHINELYRRESERDEENEALEKVGKALMSSVEDDALLHRLTEVTIEVLECDFARVMLYRNEEEAFTLSATRGEPIEIIDEFRFLALPRTAFGDLAERLEAGQLIQANPKQSDDFHRSLHQRLGVSHAMFIPLKLDDRLVGTLVAGYHGRTEPFSPLAEQIAHGIARITAMAMENVRLVGDLDRANSVKDEFVATMSHELRSPLNVLIGYCELLLDGAFEPLKGEQTDIVKKLKQQSEYLLTMVNATLDLSRLQAGRIPVEVSEIEPQEFLTGLKREIESSFNRRDVRLEWRIDLDLPVLRSDRAKLQLILRNLLNNALKFTERGYVRLFARRSQGGIEFSVEDTGIGIPEEAHETIFEPFRQADSSISARFGGSGLGLSIVKRMAELLGGTVSVDSKPNSGSTFTVWMPRVTDRGA